MEKSIVSIVAIDHIDRARWVDPARFDRFQDACIQCGWRSRFPAHSPDLDSPMPSARALSWWLLYEFLPFSISRRHSSTLTQLCHINGCVTVALVARVCVAGPPPPSSSSLFVLTCFIGFLSITLGNIVKELSLAVCGQLVNWAGFDFRRTGLTPAGIVYREIRRPDGTWRRVELHGRRFTCEWTTRRGECHRRVRSLGR